MSWSERPANWGAPGHTNRGWEAEEILDRIDILSSLGHQVVSIGSTSDTTTSSSFEAITNYSMSFTKIRDWTPLVVRIGMSCFSTAATTEIELAARINGVNYTIIDGFFFNEANSHRSIGGAERISGGNVPAGVQLVEIYWRRVSGAGTLTVGSGDDYLTAEVQELVN